ncbi:MAG: helix-turn-helix transcriptional regulator [Novosphingobium sp.]
MTARVATILNTDYAPNRLDSSSLISSIGTDQFAEELLVTAHNLCGAEHCSIVQFRGAELFGRASASIDHSNASRMQLKLYIDGSFWQRDPGFLEAQRQIAKRTLSLLQVKIEEIEDVSLRKTIWSSHDISDRLLLWAGNPENALGLSFCRSSQSGGFTRSELADLQRWSLPMLSMLKKHAAISWSTPRFPQALTSLAHIEMCIGASGTRLPRREFEVSSRLIYGMTTAGIALDLGIGEGSVITYRKRLYERLNIGSQRELLVWYVGLWDQMFATELQAN